MLLCWLRQNLNFLGARTNGCRSFATNGVPDSPTSPSPPDAASGPGWFIHEISFGFFVVNLFKSAIVKRGLRLPCDLVAQISCFCKAQPKLVQRFAFDVNIYW